MCSQTSSKAESLAMSFELHGAVSIFTEVLTFKNIEVTTEELMPLTLCWLQINPDYRQHKSQLSLALPFTVHVGFFRCKMRFVCLSHCLEE